MTEPAFDKNSYPAGEISESDFLTLFDMTKMAAIKDLIDSNPEHFHELMIEKFNAKYCEYLKGEK